MSTQPWQDRIFMTSVKYLTIGSLLLIKFVQYLIGTCKDLGFALCCLALLRHFSEISGWLSGPCCPLDSIQELYSAFQKCSPQMCLLATVDHNSRARRSSKKWEVAKLRASKRFLLDLFLSSGKKLFLRSGLRRIWCWFISTRVSPAVTVNTKNKEEF